MKEWVTVPVGHRADRERLTTAGVLTGLALATALLVQGCGAAPTATPFGSVATLPATSSASLEPTSSASVEPTGSRASLPDLVVYDPSGENAGLWAIDPNLEPSAPGWRRRISTPPGTWKPTAQAGGFLVLTSVGQTPPRVALTRLFVNKLESSWELGLPGDWDGGSAPCVSSAGTVVVKDGETLYVVEKNQSLTLIPNQRGNLGECAWLDPGTVIWDQEDAPMALWTVGGPAPSETGVRGMWPTVGGGRLAWYEGNRGVIRVAATKLSSTGLELTRELVDLQVASPGQLSLTSDGRWLVGLGLAAGDTLSILSVSESGVVQDKVIPWAALPFDVGGTVGWLPSSS
jgi:hypothetical protein